MRCTWTCYVGYFHEWYIHISLSWWTQKLYCNFQTSHRVHSVFPSDPREATPFFNEHPVISRGLPPHSLQPKLSHRDTFKELLLSTTSQPSLYFQYSFKMHHPNETQESSDFLFGCYDCSKHPWKCYWIKLETAPADGHSGYCQRCHIAENRLECSIWPFTDSMLTSCYLGIILAMKAYFKL